jgi:uncharacterized protein YlxW (UPF0749 family)
MLLAPWYLRQAQTMAATDLANEVERLRQEERRLRQSVSSQANALCRMREQRLADREQISRLTAEVEKLTARNGGRR